MEAMPENSSCLQWDRGTHQTPHTSSGETHWPASSACSVWMSCFYTEVTWFCQSEQRLAQICGPCVSWQKEPELHQHCRAAGQLLREDSVRQGTGGMGSRCQALHHSKTNKVKKETWDRIYQISVFVFTSHITETRRPILHAVCCVQRAHS